jgi:hypothetical protein
VIRARYQALCSEGSLTEERQALVDALATMRVLTGTHSNPWPGKHERKLML